MAVVPFEQADGRLLSILMRTKAEGEGKRGMLMVGNTEVNRVRGDGTAFTEIDTVRKMAFQIPGCFKAAH